MGRRKYVKIPKRIELKCPHCTSSSRVNLEKDTSLPYFDCSKCEKRIITPLAQCCVVCAFSNKKCPAALRMEAFTKKLEMR